MNDPVRRLHRALLDELRRRGRDPAQPLNVSEVYEDLVPYRTARSVLDVHVRGDYEHALLRLLAGEGSLLRIEPAEARDELRREVDKPYPDVALYRKFAAFRVFVDPAGTGAEPAPATQAPDPADRSGGADGSGGGPAEAAPGRSPETPVSRRTRDAPSESPEPPGPPGPDPPGPEPAGADADCRFCGHTLPVDRPTRFCPQCGGDQRMEPCARCGEPLESSWRFCIACGLETG